MSDGPVEYLVVEFPGNEFHRELVAALNDLVTTRTVHILDLVLVAKDLEGNVESLEIDDLAVEVNALFVDLDGEYDGLFGEEDIELAAAALEPGHMAVVIVFENSWAARFVNAMRAAGGVVVANERIPAEVIDAALAGLETQEAQA
jgi:hypothetical protein